MILGHGLIMNGGVPHAIECLPAELEEVCRGHEYYGLDKVATQLREASSLVLQTEPLDSLEAQLIRSVLASRSR